MPDKIENKYNCNVCYKSYGNVLMAVACEKSHKILYVPLYREDIEKFIKYVFTGDNKLIPERMMTTLMNYLKVKENKGEEE